jgi:outer membrane receptor protein involved in Fe transport
MKDSFDGAADLLQFGTTTRGDGQQYRLVQTLGTAWRSGHVFLNYEYAQHDPVSSLDRDFSRSLNSPIDLVGAEKQHAAYATIRNDLFGGADVHADLMYSQRSLMMDFADESLGPALYQPLSRQYGAVMGVTMSGRSGWTFDVTANWNRSELSSHVFASAGRALETRSASTLRSMEATANGEFVSLPAGRSHLALGIEYRTESFGSTAQQNMSNGTRTIRFPMEDSIVRSAFVEVSLPLLPADRLLLSMAGRFQDYSRFGQAFTPKTGLVYQPTDYLTLRATHGTSIRAPSVYQLGTANDVANIADVPDPNSGSGTTHAALIVGNNPHLREETAVTWTAGTDLRLDVGAGLTLSATYFDADYRDRIEQPPGAEQPNLALSRADASEFITRRGEAGFDSLLSALLGEVPRIVCARRFRDPVTNSCMEHPENLGAIADLRLSNIARVATSGIDWRIEQKMQTSIGDFELEVDATKVLQYEFRLTDKSDPQVLVGVVGNPVRWRSRGGVTWQRKGWTAGAYVNYVSGYLNNADDVESKVAPWRTVDLHAGYEVIPKEGSTWWKRLTLHLNVDNVFDRDPPFFANDATRLQIGYDPRIANPFGRQVVGTAHLSW